MAKKFRTTEKFVVTTGNTDRVRGTAFSYEYAEKIGERLRVGTVYTVWVKEHDGLFHAWRTVRSGQ
jgi:hypothetical protein